MIPVAELKSYTEYVYSYLHSVLSESSLNAKFGNKRVSLQEFMTSFNVLAEIKVRKSNKELQNVIDNSLRLLVVSNLFLTIFPPPLSQCREPSSHFLA